MGDPRGACFEMVRISDGDQLSDGGLALQEDQMMSAGQALVTSLSASVTRACGEEAETIDVRPYIGYFPGAGGRNQFLLLLKPEVTLAGSPANLRATLDLLLSTLHRWGIAIGGIRVFSSTFVRTHHLVPSLYRILHRVSMYGVAGMSQGSLARLMKLFSGVRAEEQIRGAYQFLADNDHVTARSLSVMGDSVGTVKIGSGVYAVALPIKGHSMVVLNPFHPHQASWLSMPGSCLVAFECFTNHEWRVLRSQVAGGIEPCIAAIGSLRRTLYDQQEKLGLLRSLCIAYNGIHVSPGPVEALFQLTDLFAPQACDHLPITSLGRLLTRQQLARLLSLGRDAARLSAISGETIFDVTEDVDTEDVVPLVAHFLKT